MKKSLLIQQKPYQWFLHNKKQKTLMRGLLLCCIMFLTIFDPVYSQEVKLNLNMKNATVEKVVGEIKKQSNFDFIYDANMISKLPRVSLDLKDATIESVLEACLKGTKVWYKIDKNVIMLVPSNEVHPKTNPEKKEKKLEINGKVTDKDGIPLPGATVLEEETMNGTTSDENGNFKLEISAETTVFIVSYIGFDKQEIAVGNKTEFIVVLKQSENSLDEVVVIGYGTAKRGCIGSAISQVKSKEIEEKSVGAISFEQVLGGQIKGLQIIQNSGAPGDAAVIHIRGRTSPFINSSSNQPLYVIDGVPFNTDPQFDVGDYSDLGENPLLSVNPEDIESFSVLKDAAATAIYGSRGANGVILITTKRGEKNSGIKTTIGYSLSLNNPIKKLDVLDADGFKELHGMIARNTMEAYALGNASLSAYNTAVQVIDPVTDEFRESLFDLATGNTLSVFGDANTNWQNEVYRKNAPTHQWNINMSGGDARTNFSLGVSYIDQKPLMLNSSFKRYGARLGIDSEVNSWLKIGSSLNYSGIKNNPRAFVNTSAQMRPDYAVYDENGDFQRYPIFGNISPGMVMVVVEAPNPVAGLESENVIKSTSFIGNVYAEAKVCKGLKFKAVVNAAAFKTRSRNFQPLRTQYLAYGSTNSLTNSISENYNTSFNLQANYHKTIAEHNFDFMVGGSWDKANYYRNYVSYADLADDYVLTNAPSASTVTAYGEGEAFSRINSIYSRLQYSYNGKYTATLNFRTDKSSKFGPGNKRAYFPSIALNWNIDREDFMNDFEWVNRLSLRASYGKTGSSNVADFTYLQYFEAGTTIDKEYETGNGTIVPTTTYPNIDIHWESTKELNLGLDFSLFSNRLYGSFDVYTKNTDGILISSPYPLESGASNYTSNLAEISNKGWEFEIGGELVRTKDFSWSLNFNIAANRNKVESMEGAALSSTQSKYYTVGEPVGIIKGYRVEKIIQSQEEIDALNAASPTGVYHNTYTAPGDYLFKDLDGDGRVTSEDQETIGSTEPDYFGGINTAFSYKRLSLAVSFQYSIGNESRWGDYSLLNVYSFGLNGLSESLTDTWTPENTEATYTRLIYGYSQNGTVSDAILQDASFLRMKMVRLSYDFPQKILSKVSLRNAVIYVSASNLFTWTSFKGTDPEAGGGSNNFESYPYSKTISFGVKIGL